MFSNWERQQMLKHNAVRVPFADLSPAVQNLIAGPTPRELRDTRKYSLKKQRSDRLKFELATGSQGVLALAAQAIHFYPFTGIFTGNAVLAGAFRTVAAHEIQEKHREITHAMKKFGTLKAGASEKKFPPDWINPVIVSETHPIFSVQRNGDIIFRRVTRGEFWQIKKQEKWIGKLGVNPWRWRGTLRKPLAPEVERKKYFNWMRQFADRLVPKPLPSPKPVPVPVRRMTPFTRRIGRK